jgi:hypothetical protein
MRDTNLLLPSHFIQYYIGITSAVGMLSLNNLIIKHTKEKTLYAVKIVEYPKAKAKFAGV